MIRGRRIKKSNIKSSSTLTREMNKPSLTLTHEIEKKMIDDITSDIKSSLTPYIEMKIRYYIDQRLGLITRGDELLTRGNQQFAIQEDAASGYKSFLFKSNGQVVAKITSEGVLYVKNIWLNGLNILSSLQTVLNSINDGNLNFVKHSDLKNGTYIMDISHITTNTLNIEDTSFSSTDNHLNITADDITLNCEAEVVLKIENSNDERYNKISLNGNYLIADKYENSLSLNGVVEGVDLGGLNKLSRFNSRINHFLSKTTSNSLLFGKSDDIGDCLDVEYIHAGDNDANNRVEISFWDYANKLLSFYRNKITFGVPQVFMFNTNNDMILKIGSHEANARCFNIYYENMLNTSDCKATVGLQGHPALRFKTDNLEVLMNLLVSTITGTGNWQTTGTMTANVYYGNVSNVSTVNCSSLNVSGNLIKQLINTLAAGEAVGFMFGKDDSNSYASGVLSYNCVSPISNSYLDLKINGMSGLRVYADKVESIIPFTCPSLTVGGNSVDAANIAYKNQSNTFTRPQIISFDTGYVLPLALYTGSTSITRIHLGCDSSNCSCIEHVKEYANQQYMNLYNISNGNEIKYLTFADNSGSPEVDVAAKGVFAEQVFINKSGGSPLQIYNRTGDNYIRIGFNQYVNNCAIFGYRYGGSDESPNSYGLLWIGNEDVLKFFSSKVDILKPLNITGKTTISQTSADALEVYNTTANSNAYIWVGNSGADNENRGTFGWVGNATASNRCVSAWCRGVQIQSWYQNRSIILKPLEITGQTTIYLNDSSNDVVPLRVFNNNQIAGKWTGIQFGKNTGAGNTGSIRFIYQGDNNANNRIDFNHWGISNPMSIYRNKITVNNGAFYINSTDAFNVSTWNMSLRIIDSTAKSGVSKPTIAIGKDETSRNCALIHYEHSGTTASNENYLSIGHWGPTENINIYGDRTEFVYKVETRQTTPANAFGANMKANILKLMYPVGSVYQNATDSRNPNDILGANIGTWTQIQNYYLYANPNGSTTGPNGGYGGNINHQHLFGFKYCGYFTQMRGLNGGDAIDYLDGDGSWAQAVHNGSNSVSYDNHGGGNTSGNVYQQTTHTTSSGSYPPFYRVWTWYRSA